MKFTEEQIEFLEDKVVNLITPVHGMLNIFIIRGKLSMKDINMMMDRLEKTAEFVRSLRKL